MSSKKRKRPQRSIPPTSPQVPRPQTTTARQRVVDAHDTPPAPRPVDPLVPTAPTWGTTTGEWLRGKAELFWESGVVPVLGWFGWLFERLGFGRRMRSINERSMRNTGELRTWNDAGVGMLKRVSRILMVAAVSAAVLVVFTALAARAIGALSSFHSGLSLGLGSSSTTATPAGAITIRNASGPDSGTPQGIPPYTLGMWMSNMSPSPGEDVTVYAKVCNLSTPVPNAQVTFSLGGNTVHLSTDQDGIASWKVNADGPGSVPEEIDGSVTVGSQTLTASTFFSPI